MGTRRCWSVAAVALAVGMAGCTHLVHWEDLEGAFDDIHATLADHEDRITGLESDMDQMREDFAALRVELDQMREDFDAHVQDTLIHAGMRVSLPVHFDFDRAEIRDVDRPLLDRFAMAITRAYPEALITLEGFTDPAGSPSYNMRLGQRRTAAVRAYLVEQGGLNPDLIRTVSFGELRDRQVNPGAMGPGHSGIENRRVGFVIEWAGREGEIGPLEGQRHGN